LILLGTTYDTTDSYSVNTDSNITITLKGTNSGKMEDNITITKTNAGSLLSVSGTGELILEDITLRGNDSNNAALVSVGGKLTMKSGSRITGNSNSNTANNLGGGVYVTSSFIMEDGSSIDNNKATADAGKGGGVYIYTSGTLSMLGGSITKNEAGNTDTTSSTFGGGIFGVTASLFIMEGGIISENKGLAAGTNSTMMGGGVYAAKFSMLGGSILQNTALKGGGVCIPANAANYFKMSGGIIAGNTASTEGAAILLYSSGTFEKTGGIIYGTGAVDGNANCGTAGTTGIHAIQMGNGTNMKAYYDDTANETTTLKYSTVNGYTNSGW
jgi:hypothetical protein